MPSPQPQIAPQIEPAEIFVVGVGRRSAPVDLRERLFLDLDGQAALLADMRQAGVAQALVLYTCDRIEAHGAALDAGDAIQRIVGCLARAAGIDADEVERHCYRLDGIEAVRHIFAVASALDSATIGEPQVLGQLKQSHRLARQAGIVGSELETAMQAAYQAAKRVRRETTVAQGPVSLAAAAARIARDIHGELSAAGCVMIGTSEMAELIVEHLRSAGLAHLVVMHRRTARAEAIAHRLDCHFAGLEEIDDRLAAAEIVISAVGTGRHQVDTAMVRRSLARRRNKPMFLIDAAIPADIEPMVHELADAFVYNLDDLERLALVNRAEREAAANSAWRLVDEEISVFARDRAERQAVPAITWLRQRFEVEREAVLDEAGGDALRATRLLVNRLLHGPSTALRRMAADGADQTAIEAMLRRMFARAPGDGIDIDGDNDGKIGDNGDTDNDNNIDDNEGELR